MESYAMESPLLWVVMSEGSGPPKYFCFARSEEMARSVFGVFARGGKLQVVTEGDAVRWGLGGYEGDRESPEPIMACLVLRCGDGKAILLA